MERKQTPHFSAVVDKSVIAENGYNLSVNTYVEPEDTREVINIDELNERIDRIVERENVLRAEIKKIIAELTAELTARKQQYEYYREKLLTTNEEFDKLPF